MLQRVPSCHDQQERPSNPMEEGEDVSKTQERSQVVGAEIEGEHQAQHAEDDCGVMQKTILVASGQSELNQNLTHSALLLNGSRESSLGNASTSHGPDLVQDEGPKNLELDKSLPPIKTRREGQAREHSPSDLSPPSPKRLRQGSRESQEQWNGLWSAEGKQ